MPNLVGRMTLALSSTLLLAACQSAPDRPDRDGEAPRAITTVAPLSLVLVGLDADQDQGLTRQELDDGLGALFRGADIDGDGQLNMAELGDWFARHLGSPYPVPGRLAFDPNGDQAVTSAEFGSVLSNAFTRMDQNGDGVVLRSEMIREVTLGAGRNRQARGGRGRGGGRPR